MTARNLAANLLSRRGFEFRRTITKRDGSLDPQTVATVEAVRPYTMTSPERVIAAVDAVRYVARNHIPGAIVECGVWAGGVSMAMARTLIECRSVDRDIWLYDTFAGMSSPTAADVDRRGVAAEQTMEKLDEPWCYAPEDAVRANFARTGYPTNRIRLVKGKVEDTIPDAVPSSIAVLRLDTDWYESTQHELAHLAPLVSEGGVLLIDDYGHWAGARRAVDEWIETCGFPVFLARTDYSGRAAVIRRG